MFSPGQYLREVSEEVKKVSWPSRKQTIEMTILVVGVSLLISAYIGALDYVFQQVVVKVLLGA
ncbi:MAG: preprotein translocase subunit SecE [Candidatus Pacebacteria bacterium CG_4_10_14_0_8_um_filter_43_12]|nr:MAG: preprotein translocase subunit SecE [Candidatus Pacebacteria bacterium CG10_big_fil_rev_8_21_14_0_10_44_11]PIY79790.1 MAG: preprotein translocase subunit SecE [Candidatus Pacebacteria bacterium CG_4_10_14_0_8_um_filter_43_12]